MISDDVLFRCGLERLLADGTNIKVGLSGEALPPARRGNGLGGMVILVDGRMAGGAEAAIDAARSHRDARVILLGAEDVSGARALAAGVRGLLGRNSRVEDLHKAIRVVSQGQIWARRQVMEELINTGMKGPILRSPARARFDDRLSVREKSVFRQAARGLSNKEIAQQLEISSATVKAHLTSIFRKLDLHSRAELAAAYHDVRD